MAGEVNSQNHKLPLIYQPDLLVGRHRSYNLPQIIDMIGAPGMIRTCDPLIRSQVLYPTELRVHWEVERLRNSSLKTKDLKDFRTSERWKLNIRACFESVKNRKPETVNREP